MTERVANRKNAVAKSEGTPGITHSDTDLRSTRCGRVVRLALDYIHAHYHRPIQRSDVAAFVRMNPTYFSTMFAEVIGITFRKYLEEFRLAKARELLTDYRKEINEVAGAVGYSCSNRFRDVFKANTGLSPSAWRKQVAIRQIKAKPTE